MIRTVIFDGFEAQLLNPSSQFLQQYQPNHERLKQEFAKVNERPGGGLLSYEEHMSGMVRVTGLNVSFAREYLYKDSIRNDDLFTSMEMLRGKYKLGLLSSTGTGSFEQFFAQNEPHELFDMAVPSYQVSMVKPDPEIYLLTARDLGYGSEKCVMIDDSQSNCGGAMQADMRAIQYEDLTIFRSEFMSVAQGRN